MSISFLQDEKGRAIEDAPTILSSFQDTGHDFLMGLARELDQKQEKAPRRLWRVNRASRSFRYPHNESANRDAGFGPRRARKLNQRVDHDVPSGAIFSPRRSFREFSCPDRRHRTGGCQPCLTFECSHEIVGLLPGAQPCCFRGFWCHSRRPEPWPAPAVEGGAVGVEGAVEVEGRAAEQWPWPADVAAEEEAAA